MFCSIVFAFLGNVIMKNYNLGEKILGANLIHFAMPSITYAAEALLTIPFLPLPTNQLTNQLTNQPTNQPTNLPGIV
jgi:hypothetical protein